MRKIFGVLLSVLCICCAAIGLTGCKKDKHIHAFDKQVITDEYKATDATCTEAATYYYSCECGEKGTETFTSGNALGHSFTNYVSDNNATCTEDGTKTAKCDRCDKKNTVKDIDSKLHHSYTEQIVSDEYLAAPATCTEKAKYYYSCKCGEKGAETFEYGEIDPKNHDYKDVITAPTKYTDGYTTHTCAHCGNAFNDSITYATGSIGLEFENLNDSNDCAVTGIGACTDTEVYIPALSPSGKKVKKISRRAFMGCNDITAIHIPKYVESIGHQAFHKASNLRVIYVNSDFLRASANDVSVFNTPSIKKIIFGGELVGDYLLNGCTNIAEVEIKNGVTSIGRNAFDGCEGLTSVTISDSITSIGKYAFRWCSSLTSVTIGNGVTEIGNYAFGYCIGLTSITIPDGVTEIGEYAFFNCIRLTGITIPDGVTKVGRGAFFACERLTNITIPGGVTEIGWGTFYACSALTSVTIPNSVAFIGDSAFGSCSSLTSVTIGNGVTEIGNYAFEYCSGLTSITIPDSVTSIGDSAFSWCSSLTNVTIGNGVTSIGTIAFKSCGLEDIYIIDLTAWCKIDGLNNLMAFTSNKNIYLNGELITDLTIPKNVTSIGGYAFYGCSGITSVTIPDSVAFIGDSAFAHCSGITSVTIPDSVAFIGDSAFTHCSGITSVTIPDSVYSIGYGAFVKCSGLTSVTIPDSVYSINGAFDNCDNLKYNEYDNAYYLGNKNNPYFALIKAKNISIGSCLINANTKIIDYSAFRGCSGLTSIIIPNSVTSIGDLAFYDCSGLTSVTIPDSVTSIGDDAFYNCSGLTSVTIGNSVTSIGNYAFRDCSGLKNITYTGTIADWKNITKGINWNYEVPTDCIIHCTDGDLKISD